MTMIAASDLCRITVVGPDRRVDLAVPVSITIADLLPALVRQVGEPAVTVAPEAVWVLQRLGGEPMPSDSTPELLDWVEGEVLYLRGTEAALPALAFDDVADGMATTVTAQPGRWQGEDNFWLFLGLSVALLLLLARVLLDAEVESVSWPAATVIAVALLGGSLIAGRNAAAPAMVVLLGVAGSGFAGLAAAVAVGGTAGTLAAQPLPMLAGASALAATGGLMVLATVLRHPAVSFVPFGLLLAAGALTAAAEGIYLSANWTAPQLAGTVSAVVLLALIYAPRAVTRVAGLRVPQLPRSAAEMQQDIEPMPAAELAARTVLSDRLLVIVTVTAAGALALAAPILAAAGPFGMGLEVALIVAVLVRAGAFRSRWQRIALTAAGSWGIGQVVLPVMAMLAPGPQALLLAALAGSLIALQVAMVRPATRRLLPIWGQVAGYGELISAAAVLPLLLQLFGAYAWARGLMN